MNLIDNGVKKVIKVSRIVTDDKLCFQVDVIDYYDRAKSIDVTTMKEVDHMYNNKYHWVE